MDSFENGLFEEPDIVITDADNDRYSRLRLIQGWEQNKIKASTIMVVGAGALGNEVLKNLALLGIGRIIIVDFDYIETSNLSRSILFRQEDAGVSKAAIAAERVKKINPDIQTKYFRTNVIWGLGLSVFRRVDVVIGCLDNREARLSVNRHCWRVNVPWVDGGLDQFIGLARVFVPPDGICYECTLSEVDYEFLNERIACGQLSESALVEGLVPTTPTIASIIGAIQVQEALKLLNPNIGIDTLVGRGLLFNGRSNTFESFAYTRNDSCLSHDTYSNIVEFSKGSANCLVKQLFALLETQLENPPKYIELRHEIILSLQCVHCGTNKPVMQPLHYIQPSRFICKDCGQQLMPDITHYIDRSGLFDEYKLKDLGVPMGDILIVRSDALEPIFVELSQDVDILMGFEIQEENNATTRSALKDGS